MSDDKEVAVMNEPVAMMNDDDSARGAKEAATGAKKAASQSKSVDEEDEPKRYMYTKNGVLKVATASSEVYRIFHARVRKHKQHGEVPERMWRELDANGVERIAEEGWEEFKRTQKGPSTKRKGEKRNAEEPTAKRGGGEGCVKTKRTYNEDDEEVENEIRGLLEYIGEGEEALIKKLMASSKAVRDAVMLSKRMVAKAAA